MACCAILVVASLRPPVVGARRRSLGPAVGIAAAGRAARRHRRLAAPSSPAATSASPGLASTTTWRCTWSTSTTWSTRAGLCRRASSTATRSGPHSLVGTVVSVFGTQPLYGWLGLLVVVPVLTGDHLACGLPRAAAAGGILVAAVLVSAAYLTASVLGIAGFKELIAGMFLIAFALGLREIERESRRADRDRGRAGPDHGGDGAGLQLARRRLAGDHRRPVDRGPAPPRSGRRAVRTASGR